MDIVYVLYPFYAMIATIGYKHYSMFTWYLNFKSIVKYNVGQQ